MPDIKELYQQVIIDHSQSPHNFGPLADASYSQEGYNPLCGDKLQLFLKEEEGIITGVSFQGSGCAISTASASLMSEAIKNKSIAEIFTLFEEFQQMLTKGETTHLPQLGKLSILAGVIEFPMRIKCATLAWHTLKAALKQSTTPNLAK